MSTTSARRNEVAAALEAGVASGKSVFLHFAPYAVLAPLMEHPEFAKNYPDLEPRERAYASMVEALDAAFGHVLATIARAARVATPQSETVDGVALWGDPSALERAIVWHMPHFWGVEGPGIGPYSGVLQNDWKLLYFHERVAGAEEHDEGRGFELYDLDSDPGEEVNLAVTEPEQLERMVRLLSGELHRAGARMSIAKATGEPIPGPLAWWVRQFAEQRAK